MSRPIVQARDLTVRYGRRTVLDGVSLEVAEGEVLAVLGRNGIGKSSLVRCLLGQQVPTDGSCLLFGDDSLRHRPRLMRRVGAVPEVPDAPPRATVRQLGTFTARLHPGWSDALYTERLERFGVPLGSPFAALSRGQKTQVMLALALAPRPELLVLDDPTLGLDAVARRAVISELVDELAERGTPMLVASHDLAGLERLATHVALLAGGRVVLAEEADALKQRLRWIAVVDEETGTADGTTAVDEALERLEPLARRSLPGRGREVLVGRFDDAVADELSRRLGPQAVDVRFATLEDFVVATTGDASTLETSP